MNYGMQRRQGPTLLQALVAGVLVAPLIAGCLTGDGSHLPSWSWHETERASYRAERVDGSFIGWVNVSLDWSVEPSWHANAGNLHVEAVLPGAGIPRKYEQQMAVDPPTGQVLWMTLANDPDGDPLFDAAGIQFLHGSDRSVPNTESLAQSDFSYNPRRAWAPVGPQWPLAEIVSGRDVTAWGAAAVNASFDPAGWVVRSSAPCDIGCDRGVPGRPIDYVRMHGDWEHLLPKKIVFGEERLGDIVQLHATQRFGQGSISMQPVAPASPDPEVVECPLPPCGIDGDGRYSFERGAAILLDSPQWAAWTSQNPDWHPASFVLLPRRTQFGDAPLDSLPGWIFRIVSGDGEAIFEVDATANAGLVTSFRTEPRFTPFLEPWADYPLPTVHFPQALDEALRAVGAVRDNVTGISYLVSNQQERPALWAQHVIGVSLEGTLYGAVSFSMVTGDLLSAAPR